MNTRFGFRRAVIAWAVCLFFVVEARAQAQLLQPDQAFHVLARQTGSQTFDLTYSMEPGYYLYKDRFSFKTDSPTNRVAAIEMVPPKRKHDRALDKVVEYFDETVTVKVTLQVPAAGKKAPFHLLTVAQGCAQVGVCYPPIARSFLVEGGRP